MNKVHKNTYVIAALGIASVYIVTSFLVFPLGTLGYINIGDAIILLFANLVSPIFSFAVGGIGSMLADLLLAPQYAIFTFFIKGFEGYIASYFLRKEIKYGFIIAGAIVVIGYALTDIILTGQIYMALPSIGFNSIQMIVCIIIASVGKPYIKKIGKQ